MGKLAYVKGSWLAICDRCGFEYKGPELKKEWTGLMVCKKCWEPRHEQDFLRAKKETTTPPWTRPEPADGGVTSHGDVDATLYSQTDTILHYWDVELTANREVELDDAILSPTDNGSRFIIYRTAGGAGTLKVRDDGLVTIKIIPANVNAVVETEFDTTKGGWRLVDYYTI